MGQCLGRCVKACNTLSVVHASWRVRGLLQYGVRITAPNQVSGLVWRGPNIQATTVRHVYTPAIIITPAHATKAAYQRGFIDILE